MAVDVVATSTFYWSEPVGPHGERPFLNAAVVVETSLGPWELRGELRRLEPVVPSLSLICVAHLMKFLSSAVRYESGTR